eukprot:6408645-Amphidinium_carterae.1
MALPFPTKDNLTRATLDLLSSLTCRCFGYYGEQMGYQAGCCRHHLQDRRGIYVFCPTKGASLAVQLDEMLCNNNFALCALQSDTRFNLTFWSMRHRHAGATFMAAGGSAPELFTSLIGATARQ